MALCLRYSLKQRIVVDMTTTNKRVNLNVTVKTVEFMPGKFRDWYVCGGCDESFSERGIRVHQNHRHVYNLCVPRYADQ